MTYHKISITETDRIEEDELLSVATSAIAYCLGHINESMPGLQKTEFYAEKLLKILDILTGDDLDDYKNL